MKKFLTLFFVIIPLVLISQTKVGGLVIDESGTPVAFANIVFEDSSEGTITNDNGRFYFESDETTINATGSGVFYQEIFTFEAFSDPNIADRVIDGTITYQIENTTSKPLSLLIEFLDAGGNVLDSEPFIVNEEPTALLERQVAYGDGGKSLDILRNTTNIRVSGENLGDATSQSSQNEPKVILRSSAAFRIRLR